MIAVFLAVVAVASLGAAAALAHGVGAPVVVVAASAACPPAAALAAARWGATAARNRRPLAWAALGKRPASMLAREALPGVAFLMLTSAILGAASVPALRDVVHDAARRALSPPRDGVAVQAAPDLWLAVTAGGRVAGVGLSEGGRVVRLSARGWNEGSLEEAIVEFPDGVAEMDEARVEGAIGGIEPPALPPGREAAERAVRTILAAIGGAALGLRLGGKWPFLVPVLAGLGALGLTIW